MQKTAPICAFDIDPSGKSTPCSDLNPALVAALGGGYRWVHFDLNDPNLLEWFESQLPGVVAQALLQKETRPRCDGFENGILLNLRGVNLNPNADPEDMVSLRLWVAQGLIVSARLRKVWAVDALRQQFSENKGPKSIGEFLAVLSQALTKRIEKVSLDLEEETDSLEEQMIRDFNGLSPKVAPIRQSVIKLRRFVGPQREALTALASPEHEIIEEAARARLAETANRAMRTVEELDSTRERLAAIQDHLDVQHTIQMSRTSYALSVVATVFLPLGFITGLFGVNLAGMPGIESTGAFLILTISCAAIGVFAFFLLKYLKWF